MGKEGAEKMGWMGGNAEGSVEAEAQERVVIAWMADGERKGGVVLGGWEGVCWFDMFGVWDCGSDWNSSADG